MIIDEKEYLDVISKKTASLFDACAKIGAVTSGADANTIRQFGIMGHYLGIAFQIRDDIFDYFSQDVGKPTGNDIREGKITLPLIYVLRSCKDAAKRQEMLDLIESKEYTDENIDRLLSFAKEEGGIEYAYEQLNHHAKKAETIVNESAMDEDLKEVMGTLFLYLKDRKY